MAVHKCCTFCLNKKNLLSPTPDACCALLALRNIQLMTGEPRPPVQRAPVTWREWGLWFHPPLSHLCSCLQERIQQIAASLRPIAGNHNPVVCPHGRIPHAEDQWQRRHVHVMPYWCESSLFSHLCLFNSETVWNFILYIIIKSTWRYIINNIWIVTLTLISGVFNCPCGVLCCMVDIVMFG